MDNLKICVLCYNSSSETKQINLFGNIRCYSPNIVAIIKKHFWFKILEKDTCPTKNNNSICIDCWTKTKNFNTFYNNVEYLHNNSFIDFQSSEQIVKIENSNCNSSIDVQLEQPIIKIEPTHNSIIDNNDYYENSIELTEEKYDDMSKKDIILRNGRTRSTLDNNKKRTTIKRDKKNSESKIKITKAKKNKKTDIITRKPIPEENITILPSENSIIDLHLKEETLSEPTDSRSVVVDEIDNAAAADDDDDDNDDDNDNNNGIKKKLQIEREDAQIREYFKMQCDLCEVEFLTFLNAKQHYRERHKIGGYLRCCKRKFRRRGVVLEHIVRHLNPEAYKCTVCQKIYSNKIALRTHMEMHAPDLIRPFKCEMCEKSFVKHFELTHHVKYRHAVDNSTLICDFCDKTFLTIYTLKQHIRGVHENAYCQICDVCAKVFRSKANFKTHRQSHFLTEIKKIQCTICGTWLASKDSMRAHMSRHKEGKIKCPQCGKESANREALKDHILYVHNAPRYNCTICSKPFKYPQSLKEHMASHTGETLYTCSYCPKTFNSNANMYSHRKKKHSTEWLADKMKQQSALLIKKK